MEEWLDTITIEQLYGWIAYDQIDPGGESRDDLRIGYAFARLATIIAATNGSRVRLKPSDFIIDFEAQFRKSQPMTAESWSSFKSTMKALGKASKK